MDLIQGEVLILTSKRIDPFFYTCAYENWPLLGRPLNDRLVCHVPAALSLSTEFYTLNQTSV